MSVKFGYARKYINPSEACSLAGYFNVRMWEKILDDLEVRALVLEKDNAVFGLLQFDLVTIPQTFAEKIYKISPEIFSKKNLTITATHTHTAPEIRETKPGHSLNYIDFAASQGIEALKEAFEKLSEGKIYATRTQERRFAFNRRYWMKDGGVLTNPPKLSPEIEKPEGQADYEIPVLAIKDSSEKLKAVLANIVNHADTIGGNFISGDWPGITKRAVEKHLDSNAIFFPLIGCSGNINHLDVNSPDEQFSYSEAERIGNGYAETVIKSLNSIEELPDAPLKTAFTEIACKPREINEDEIKKAKEELEALSNITDAEDGAELHSVDLALKTPAALKYFAKELLKTANDSETRIFNINGFSLGKINVITLPAEPFVEIGLKIKNEIFPGEFTMLISHSNGTGAKSVSGGYIPNKWNFGRGGYETTPRSNPFARNAAELIVQGVKHLKSKLCG